MMCPQEDGTVWRCWYNYNSLDDWNNEVPVAAHLDESVAFVHNLIQTEFAVVGSYHRIAVVGYSQGANLALEAGLRFPVPLGLVFSMRGVMFSSRIENKTSLAVTPYVLTAGAQDD